MAVPEAPVNEERDVFLRPRKVGFPNHWEAPAPSFYPAGAQ
jgi:hypothetical protein